MFKKFHLIYCKAFFGTDSMLETIKVVNLHSVVLAKQINTMHILVPITLAILAKLAKFND